MIDDWPQIWWSALTKHFNDEAVELAGRARQGIDALLDDARALRQAYDLSNTGLLTGVGVSAEAFEMTAKSLLEVTLRDLAALANP
jgi:hypothetical protein